MKIGTERPSRIIGSGSTAIIENTPSLRGNESLTNKAYSPNKFLNGSMMEEYQPFKVNRIEQFSKYIQKPRIHVNTDRFVNL